MTGCCLPMHWRKNSVDDSAIGFHHGRPDFVDIALLYALINFIGTMHSKVLPLWKF